MTVEEVGQLGRDRGLEPEGAQVVGQGAVGGPGRGRVLEAAGLLRAGPAALDGGLGGRLQGDRPLGQGQERVPARRVAPSPLRYRRAAQVGQPLAPRRPGDGVTCRLGLMWPR